MNILFGSAIPAFNGDVQMRKEINEYSNVIYFEMMFVLIINIFAVECLARPSRIRKIPGLSLGPDNAVLTESSMVSISHFNSIPSSTLNRTM
jgi:hypothetical protein